MPYFILKYSIGPGQSVQHPNSSKYVLFGIENDFMSPSVGQHFDMFAQRRNKLAHSSTHSDKSFHCLHEKKNLHPWLSITKTRLYNFDPLKPLFYVVKLGFAGIYIIFLISAQNKDCGYSLEPPRRGGSNEYPQSMF